MKDERKTKKQLLSELTELRQRVAALEASEAERVRAEQLLRALNQAALAMGQALTPEEIFAAVAEEFRELGLFCVVSLMDEDRERLCPRYFSYEARAVKIAEKLTGLKAEDLSMPIEAAKAIWEKASIFTEGAEEVARQWLPEPAKKYAGQIVRILGIPRTITVPLIAEGEVIGALSVQSSDLTESDVPAITAFAHQMAAAWRKARLMRDLERSLAARERAEEALRDNQAQLELITDKLPALLAYVDADQRYLYVNQAYADWYGLSKQELVDKHVRGVLPEESYQGAIRQIEAVLRGEEVSYENIAYDADGGWRAVRATYVPHFDESGKVKAFLAMVEDITERKRAEEALRESEGKYRRLVQDSAEGIAIVQGLEVRFVNRALSDMFGCQNEDEMVGRSFVDFVAPRSRNLMLERGRAREAGEHVSSRYEFRALRQDGTEFDAEISVSPIAYQGGVARQGMIRDVTERKQAEEALRESEERLRSLFEGAEDHIFVVDQDFRYVTVNPSALKAGGFTLEDVVGKGPPELFPEDAEFYASQYRHAFETGGPVRFERELRLPDGPRYFAVTLSPIKDVRGDVTALTGISRDITERKRAEEALRSAYEELKQTQAQLIQSAKMAAIGELAAGVAHEINNPMTAVLGFSELLLRDTAPDAPIYKDLVDIVNEARRVREIVRGLLSFSRQTLPHREKANINQVVLKTVSLIRQRLEKTNVALEERYAPDLPSLRLDVGQMKQVVLNLIVNAIQATSRGDTLTVSTARVGDEVAVRIADTGEGIPAENLSRVFEPFFTTRPVGQGTGLGLSISLGIVQEHGGRIEVESQEGEGSTFTIFLPIE